MKQFRLSGLICLFIACLFSFGDANAVTPKASSSYSNPNILIRADKLIDGFSLKPDTTKQSVIDSLKPSLSAMQTIGMLDSISRETIAKYSEGRAFQYFIQPTRERFTQQDSINKVLSSMKESFSTLLPEVKWPLLYTIISPYNQSVINTDSVSLIAINHYLGSDFEAYLAFEPYFRKQKKVELLPIQLAESILYRDYPPTFGKDKRANVQDCIWQDGVIAYALTQLVPGATLEQVGGWTTDEVAWLNSHKEQLVKELKDKNLEQSTDELIISRLLDPAPASLVFNIHAPGRAGRFIGLQEVKRYLEAHPDSTLSQLLTIKSNPTIH